MRASATMLAIGAALLTGAPLGCSLAGADDAVDPVRAALHPSRFPALRFRRAPVVFYDYRAFVAPRAGVGASFTADVAVQAPTRAGAKSRVWIAWSSVGSAVVHTCDLAYAEDFDAGMQRWTGACAAATATAGETSTAVSLQVLAELDGVGARDDDPDGDGTRRGYIIGVDALGPVPSPATGLTVIAARAEPASRPGPAPFVHGRARVWGYNGDKSVRVAYSLDGWRTRLFADAAVVGADDDGTYAWGFYVPPGPGRVDYEVRYEVAGVAFYGPDGPRSVLVD